MHNNITQRLRILFILFVIILPYKISAQVTIGSNLTPNPGALLDLKEFDSTGGGMNSNKGMMLPRVFLTTLTSLADISNAGSEDHTGLMVYNTNDCLPNEDGVYLWLGNEWTKLGSLSAGSQADFDPVSGILTDYEGNKYTTKVFGGKRWMTQNLRSLIKSDGSFLACEQGMFLPNTRHTVGDVIKITKLLPKGAPLKYNIVKKDEVIHTPITMGREEFATKFGLFYTSKQALDACPEGWEVPTTTDWTNLVEVMKTFSSDYASAMKSDDNNYVAADAGSIGSPNGFAWSGYPEGDPRNSGFNAYPVGWGSLAHIAGATEREDQTIAFGYNTYIWAMNLTTRRVNTFKIDYNYTNIHSIETSIHANQMHSVRCVQK